MEKSKDEKIADILAQMEPMFKEAEDKNLYFFCCYQGQWLSPGKLREYHKKGQFVWAPVNWALRDPSERTEQLERGVAIAKDKLRSWLAEIGE